MLLLQITSNLIDDPVKTGSFFCLSYAFNEPDLKKKVVVFLRSGTIVTESGAKWEIPIWSCSWVNTDIIWIQRTV